MLAGCAAPKTTLRAEAPTAAAKANLPNDTGGRPAIFAKAVCASSGASRPSVIESIVFSVAKTLFMSMPAGVTRATSILKPLLSSRRTVSSSQRGIKVVR